MNQNYKEMPNGYLESINKGIQTVRTFSGHMSRGKGTQEERIQRLTEELSKLTGIIYLYEFFCHQHFSLLAAAGKAPAEASEAFEYRLSSETSPRTWTLSGKSIF